MLKHPRSTPLNATRIDRLFSKDRPTFIGYAIAILSAIAAQVARQPLHPATLIPFITYVPFVAVSVALGGFGPGLLTTALCTLESIYFAIEPVGSWTVDNPHHWVGALAFAFTGVIIAALFGRLKQMVRVAIATSQELASVHDSAPIMLLVVDDQLRVKKANAHATQFAGEELPLKSDPGLGDVLGCLEALTHTGGCGSGPECTNCAVRKAALDTATRGTRHDGVEAWISFSNGVHQSQKRCLLVSTAPFQYEDTRRTLVCAVDISSRKIAELEIERQAQLVNLSHDAIITAGADRVILGWNQGATQVYGFTASEAIGRRIPDLLNTKAARSQSEIDAALSTTGSWDGELRHTAANGDRLYVESRQVLVQGEGDDPAHILEINRDITARKAAEEEIRRQNVVQRGINRIFREALADSKRALGQTCLAVAKEVTASRVALLAEVATEESFDDAPDNLSEDDLRIEQTGYAFDAVDIDAIRIRLRRERKGFYANSPEGWQLSGKANSLPFLARLCVPLMHAGKMIGVLGLAGRAGGYSDQDLAVVEEALGPAIVQVVMRRRAEAALREASQQRGLALEAAELGAWDYRLDEGALYWDERCRDMFGIPPDEHLHYGAAIARIHPEDRPATDAAVKRALSGADGGVYHREFRVIWPDQSVHWVSSHGRAYFEGDPPRAVRFVGVNKNITDRKRADADLQQALDRAEERQRLLNAVFDAQTDGVLVLNPDRVAIQTNPAASAFFGFDPHGLNLSEIVERFRIAGGISASASERALKGETTRNAEQIAGDRIVETSASPVLDSEGRILGAVTVSRDITVRKRAEQELRETVVQLEFSLAERTVLLKEVHHRVKNNLAVISSLLGMRSESTASIEAKLVLEESQQRVHSIALIHEHLYGNKHLDRVNFSEYIRNLVEELYGTFVEDPERLCLRIEADPLELEINRAVPCALIINELVTNAFKYAFPNGREGSLAITCRETGLNQVKLTVADDGVGMPNDLDWRKSSSLGLQIVSILGKQIDAKIEVRRQHGTRFELSFPRSDEEEEQRDCA